MVNIRQTNLELLRIVAMFFVLVLHANMGIHPWPLDSDGIAANPVPGFGRLFLESLAIVCVNAFILLSGWFGISFSYKKLSFLVFQTAFFAAVLLLVPCKEADWNPAAIWAAIAKWYWFFFAYIIVFILSPLLNLFADYAPKQVFKQVLVTFFCMQTILSYLGNHYWFTDGMSPIPFIGLYLLARYIRIHQPGYARWNKQTDLFIYLLLSLILAVLSFVLTRWAGTGGRMFNYTNPLVIISSVYFFLFFQKLKVRSNPFVNWVAGSCLGVYLLHAHPWVITDYYIGTFSYLQDMTGSGALTVLLSMMFIISVFVMGILADKGFRILWNLLTRFTKPSLP